MNNEEYFIDVSNQVLLNYILSTNRRIINSIYGTVPTTGFFIGFVDELDNIVINTTIFEFKKPKKFQPKNYF